MHILAICILASDNAITFALEKLMEWCKSRWIVHLTGAPYYPATNGAAEMLVLDVQKFTDEVGNTPQSFSSVFPYAVPENTVTLWLFS